MTYRYISMILASSLVVFASPDAGQQMKQIEQDIAKKEKGSTEKQLISPKKQVSPDLTSEGFRAKVNSFNVTGMTVFDANSVVPKILKEFIGKELTLADIRKAADAIQSYYADNGLIAKVSVPAQSIEGGVVKLIVTEGKAGEVIMEDGNATKMKSEKLKGYLYNSQPKGSVLTMDGLQKGLYILNELPGFSVGSSLLPGADNGYTDILVSARDTTKVDGMLFLDNFGSRFTGSVQGTAIAAVNDVSGQGLYDQLSLRMLKTSGSNYGRLAYQIPAGVSGLKLGLNGSKMNYKINSLSVAEGYEGESSSVGISADYPLVRTKNKNLSLSATLDKKLYEDKDDTDTTMAKKRVNSLNVTLGGDSSDEYNGGGQNNYSLTLTKGNVSNIIGGSELAGGAYYKLSASASRLQRIDDSWQLFAQGTLQKSSKNLDSSEKMTIGGNSGVRAYPTGEASSDEGFLANLEGRRSLGNGWQAVMFYDYAFAHINHAATDTNAYSLHSVGVGTSWSGKGMVARLQIAKAVGNNKGEQSNGNDSDGLKPGVRALASVQYKF